MDVQHPELFVDDSVSTPEMSDICSSPDFEPLPLPEPKKMKFTSRAVVDSVKTSVLLAAHGRFYGEWSNGRKKAGSQVIPKEIWPKVNIPDVTS